MSRLAAFFMLVVMLLVAVAAPVAAQDVISYTSQPDEIAVFFNDIAYARDVVNLPGGADVRIVLPNTVYADTLVLRENGERVANYRMTRPAGTADPYTGIANGEVVIQWSSIASDGLREVSLEYLMTGIGWSPKYDMFILDDTHTDLDFFAEIHNTSLTANNIAVKLVAGRVDTAQQFNDQITFSANQALAGYAEVGGEQQSLTGAATIQHIYNIGTLQTEPGDTLYTRIAGGELAARKILLWNANTDPRVLVIYKVTNSSEAPFADGIVRAYQNGMFLGSDGIELTPIGGEGSVTVGTLQNVRVNRAETVTTTNSIFESTQHDLTLTLENFGDEDITIEVVDYYPYSAVNFTFSDEPQREGDNVLRWVVTIPAGEETIITYQYRTD
jgi:hypothetical protein